MKESKPEPSKPKSRNPVNYLISLEEEKKVEIDPASYFAHFAGKNSKPKEAPKASPRKPSPTRGMDIEDDAASDKTDATEVVEDIEKARSASPEKKKDDDEDKGYFSIKDIKKKYGQNKTTLMINKDSDDESDKGKNKTKKTANINRSKTTMETESATKPKKGKKGKDDDNMIQGPLSGYTIVPTGVFDQIDRKELEDLLKSLGAYIKKEIL